MDFHHVDVFATRPLSGNSLTVFFPESPLDPERMLEITREFRHFESTFLEPTTDPTHWRARVFDQLAELPFAGHPIIGAAAVLHRLFAQRENAEWTFDLAQRTVTATTTGHGDRIEGWLDQGEPWLDNPCAEATIASALAGLGLTRDDLADELQARIVSTGLRYLIVPVRPAALERAGIVVDDFEARLAALGAEFVYVLDPLNLEGRHWNNDGVFEDVATGSAAGTVGAYLAKAGRVAVGQSFSLRQGRFVGRPSEIAVRPEGSAEAVSRVLVGGSVVAVARGTIERTALAG